MLSGEALARWIAEKSPQDRDGAVDELLGVDPAHPTNLVGADPEGELVGYFPSGVSAVADAIRSARIGPDDVFFDLGSGIGRVAMLVRLLTGARAIGVEIDGALVESARRITARLAIGGVEHVCGDARVADLSSGSVYYLYLPFVGAAQRAVLARLEKVARTKPIAIATLGFSVDGESWLRPIDSSSLLLSLYESRASTTRRHRPALRLPSLDCIADERSLVRG